MARPDDGSRKSVARGGSRDEERHVRVFRIKANKDRLGLQIDTETIADGGLIPDVIARGAEIVLAPPGRNDRISIHNDTDRPLFFVVEDRNWTTDAPARQALSGRRMSTSRV